jgi:cysteinyl-tRNA synthetase
MEKIYLYNTLTRKKEVFSPLKKDLVGIYTCGPTVYNYAHIGNFRAYLFEDFLKRIFIYNGYKVKHVMNITDVGHLLGDMNMGEDKMERSAQREGKSAWQIADFYTQAFKKDLGRLNIIYPDIWCKATDNIAEQIELIKILEKKGYTYKTKDGLYFDTAKVKNYNKLSHLPLESLREGARVEKNPDKKSPTDFALWKFSPTDRKRQMEWNSPWGKGFPGWHIECSAMSLKYLQGNLDIHCGGVDHINIHHTNEIAQSEAATDKNFFNYWLHSAFLNISGGKKMAKSGDNFLTLENALLKKDIDPLAYRLAVCQVHYRKPMEYSEEGLRQAEKSLLSFRSQIVSLGEEEGNSDPDFKEQFIKAINNDLNIPQALAVLAKMMKSNLANKDKLATALDFDKVLGLDLNKKTFILEVIKPWGKNIKEISFNVPDKILKLLLKREVARLAENWQESDRLRVEIKKLGFILEDIPQGQRLIAEHHDKK